MSERPDVEWDQAMKASASARERYRAAADDELPPPELDAAILAASRRKVSARPQSIQRSLFHQWRVPLSMAAVVVLASSLSLVYYQDNSHIAVMEELPRATPLTPPVVASPAPARDAEADLRQQLEESAAPSGKIATPPATEASKSPQKKSKAAPEPRVSSNARERAVVQAPPPSAAQSPEVKALREEPPAITPKPEAEVADAEASLQLSKAPASESARIQGLRTDRDEGASAATSTLPSVTTPSTSTAAAPVAQPSAGAAASAEFSKQDVRRRAKLAEKADDFKRVPDVWLEHIKALWLQDQKEAAIAEYRAFLQQHPDFLVPENFPVPKPEKSSN